MHKGKKHKTFVESQSEGVLKDTFFKYIPDAAQVSTYLKSKFGRPKKKTGYLDKPKKRTGHTDYRKKGIFK
tara:strand:- start:616 stop:828 length:213 start_codon:yes stop_codon:yes gene_type:complete